MDNENKKAPQPQHRYMALGMCLGISIGTGIGAALDNIPFWMSTGLSIGLCVGLALDSNNRNKADDAEKQQS